MQMEEKQPITMNTMGKLYDNKQTPGNASVARTAQKLNDRSNGKPLRVLDETQWKGWIENGYVIIPNAVPAEDVEKMASLLWEFEEKDPNNNETWYAAPRAEIQMKELKNTGMVEMYNAPQMWKNRMNPRVYNAFVDIWGVEELWVTIDRANLNFPVRPGHDYKAFIHFDIDTSMVPKPVNVQGVLALSDTDEFTGGFQCVPGLYKNFDKWVKTQPAGRDPFKPDTTGFEIKKIMCKKGDLLIWNSMLAHGIRKNESDRPRLAQYISMTLAVEDNIDLVNWRVNSWRHRIAPEGYAFPGDPRNWEQTKYERAELTELGEKLLGLRKWH